MGGRKGEGGSPARFISFGPRTDAEPTLSSHAGPQDVLISRQEESRLRTAVESAEEHLQSRANDLQVTRHNAGIRVESADKHAQDVAFRLRLERQRADAAIMRLSVSPRDSAPAYAASSVSRPACSQSAPHATASLRCLRRTSSARRLVPTRQTCACRPSQPAPLYSRTQHAARQHHAH